MRRLRRLSLRAYRNYERADLDVEDGATICVGLNGQGKSNLLEAVYLVATGRSHRTPHEGDVIQHGAQATRIRAQIIRPGRDEELEMTVTREGDRVVVAMRVNGAVANRGSVLGRLPVVLATPWDLELVRGPGSGRRRLLDGAIAQLSPAYFFSLHRYHRVVTQRNAELRRRSPPGAGGAASVEPWDTQLLALGVRITAYRAAHVDHLAPAAAQWFSRLGGQGHLAMTYRPSWPGATDGEREGAARAQLSRFHADEYRRGITLSGPHRDELDLTLDEMPLRAAGSQGQTRTATLAVRLAEHTVMAQELGTSPLLLLDDAVAELDPDRQRRVFEIDADVQLLASTTVLPATNRPVHIWTVRSGTITEDVWSPRFEPS